MGLLENGTIAFYCNSLNVFLINENDLNYDFTVGLLKKKSAGNCVRW